MTSLSACQRPFAQLEVTGRDLVGVVTFLATVQRLVDSALASNVDLGIVYSSSSVSPTAFNTWVSGRVAIRSPSFLTTDRLAAAVLASLKAVLKIRSNPRRSGYFLLVFSRGFARL
jgi:hypothetical protein